MISPTVEFEVAIDSLIADEPRGSAYGTQQLDLKLYDNSDVGFGSSSIKGLFSWKQCRKPSAYLSAAIFCPGADNVRDTWCPVISSSTAYDQGHIIKLMCANFSLLRCLFYSHCSMSCRLLYMLASTGYLFIARIAVPAAYIVIISWRIWCIKKTQNWYKTGELV